VRSGDVIQLEIRDDFDQMEPIGLKPWEKNMSPEELLLRKGDIIFQNENQVFSVKSKMIASLINSKLAIFYIWLILELKMSFLKHDDLFMFFLDL
jgi:calcineurin-like phosphoesterase family protein